MLDTFSSEACHQEATGMSKTSLTAKAFNDWRDVVVGSSCLKTFFVFSYDEFEFYWPEMGGCAVSTYAALASATALVESPCRTRAKDDADFIMIPPYLANDCHWPAPHEGCDGVTNVLKAGSNCEALAMQQALSIHNDTGKPVLVLAKDAAPGTPEREEPGHAGIILARVGAATTHFREGLDVSMPPAAPTTTDQVKHEAFVEPTVMKHYFATFRGNLSSPAGEFIKTVLSDQDDCLVVSDTDPHFDNDIFFTSKFVLMSDPESYHFPEAVCSGGVPVMIAEEWAPPFDEFMPFSSYGMYLRPDKDTILKALGGLAWGEMDRMRRRAEDACLRYFQSTDLQVQMLIAGILGRGQGSNDTAQ